MRDQIPNAVLAFRGYNVTNLGRTLELLEQPAYSSIVEDHLALASRVCAKITGKPVDLLRRVRIGQEPELHEYADSIALVMAVEIAQLEILEQCHGIDYRQAPMVMGYSLGEITAAVACGVIDLESAMTVPLSLADDCSSLAENVTLAVVFSRAQTISLDEIRRLCILVNQEGQGTIGISAYLAPNTVLLVGQDDSIARFKQRAKDEISVKIVVRKNEHRWPPMHTPLVWEKYIPNRAGLLMHELPGGFEAPHPPILSLVTGRFSYNDYNAREILQRWTDHPQRLWDAIYEILSQGVEYMIHIGPQPYIIPATMSRLADNVKQQIRSNVGVRALAVAARRPWLAGLLPERTALLRAPQVKQIVLEDWLIDHVDRAKMA